MPKISKEKLIREILSRTSDEIYPSKEALFKRIKGKKMKVYLGVDATGEHLHLGHLTNFLLLRKFQDLGHEVIFLIGDFTSRIGDPSDKLAARRPLTEEEVKKNFKTFKKQAGRIIDFSGKNAAKVAFNSRWYKKMRFSDVLALAGNFTVQQMLKRSMFQRRLETGKDINLVEFFYPLMQGYDSVALDVDLEIGGSDQTFNMLVGRDLMRILKNKEKFVLTTKLLENPKTGKKLMNKSEGGTVNLDDSPADIFGKIMALPDETIVPVATFSTNMSLEEVRELPKMNPRDAKAKVAFSVVEVIYNEKEAGKARERFDRLFSRREKPLDLPVLKSKKKITVLDLVVLSGVVRSKSEARRLILQGGVKFENQTKNDPGEVLSLKGKEVLRVGKKNFFRLSA